MDGGLQPVPVGVVGELYLGGVGVGRGYWQRPELTAERFVPDPGGGGGRLYRTGDRVRYLAEGQLEFLGRLDYQAKVRGFRIELGEVEAALETHPGVRQSVVVTRPGADGEARLLGYVVGEAGAAAPGLEELRSYLKERLPEYMVPALFGVLEQLPLTPNGKVDRQGLPELGAERPALAQEYVAPRTPLEQLLSAMWGETLGQERIGVHDNFFELGGDSIRAAVFVNRLQERLGELVHVVAMFDSPTVAALAGYLEKRYASGLARLLGGTAGAGGTAEAAGEPLVDAGSLAQIRALIKPLPPRSGGLGRARNARAVFILSPPRSGSTLLRVMLGGHGGLFAPPELELLTFNTMPERGPRFFRPRAVLAGRAGAGRNGTPGVQPGGGGGAGGAGRAKRLEHPGVLWPAAAVGRAPPAGG